MGKHMDSDPKEAHVVSVMTSKPLETVERVRDDKDDRLLLHPTRRQNRLTAWAKNLHKAINMKTRKTREKFHADSNSLKTRHVSFWNLPVRLDFKTETRMCTWHVETEAKSPTRSQRKAVQRISCDIEGVYTTGL